MEKNEEIDLPTAFLHGLKNKPVGDKVNRISWDDYFMDLAHVVGTRSTCRRHNVGAVLVKDKHVISTGYNGAAPGMKDCLELGCLRDQLGIESGTRHEICRAIHAEQNAVIQAALHAKSTEGTTMYITINPCLVCAKIIAGAKVKRVVFEGSYPDDTGTRFLKEAGITLESYKTTRKERPITKKY